MFASKGTCKSGTTMYCMVAILLILRHSMGIYDRSGFVDVLVVAFIAHEICNAINYMGL
jgi:hypothetical protein